MQVLNQTELSMASGGTPPYTVEWLMGPGGTEVKVIHYAAGSGWADDFYQYFCGKCIGSGEIVNNTAVYH
jgi:hypothetical protein